MHPMNYILLLVASMLSGCQIRAELLKFEDLVAPAGPPFSELPGEHLHGSMRLLSHVCTVAFTMDRSGTPLQLRRLAGQVPFRSDHILCAGSSRMATRWAHHRTQTYSMAWQRGLDSCLSHGRAGAPPGDAHQTAPEPTGDVPGAAFGSALRGRQRSRCGLGLPATQPTRLQGLCAPAGAPRTAACARCPVSRSQTRSFDDPSTM